MTHTLLVALIRPEEDVDGVSESTLPVAVTLAEQLDADVVLTTVLDLPSEAVGNGEQRLLHAADAFPDDPRLTALREQTLAMVDRVEAYLHRVAGRFASGRVRIMVRYGDPGQELLDIAGMLDSPVVVMASHARRGIKRAMLGSVAFSVVSRAAYPVVIVPIAPETEPLATEFALNRLLVPLDGSPLAESVLDTESIAALSGHPELHLVQVIEPMTIHTRLVDDDVYAAARDEATQYLKSVADRLRERGHRVEWSIRRGPPSDEIAEVATQVNADVILMATHGRSGLRRVMMGSVAEQVLRASHRPLILIRSDIAKSNETPLMLFTAV